jgi:uncharacterized protein YcfJ
MNFTPELSVRSLRRTLTIAAVGLIGWADCISPAPIVAAANNTAPNTSYQSVAYNSSGSKTKHWLKRNAPILGGAAGGGLIGGALGGGKGALVGGAVGGGGGYLYKRHREHERRNYQH